MNELVKNSSYQQFFATAKDINLPLKRDTSQKITLASITPWTVNNISTTACRIKSGYFNIRPCLVLYKVFEAFRHTFEALNVG